MQKLLLLFILHFPHAEVVIFIRFIFLSCRNCYYWLFYVSHMQKLFFSVPIPIRQTFFGSVHCSLIQKLIFSFISPSYNAEISVIVLFTFLGMQKFLLLFVSTLPNVKVLILLHFTFLSCRSCYYCSFQVLTM